MQARLAQSIANDPRFQSFILSLILINAIVMGLETSAALVDYYDLWFYVFFIVSQIIFVAEIAVRIFACAPRFRDFFRSFWNFFDFTIVALSLIPAVGSFALIARLARVLRVARIFSTSKHLRNFLNNIATSFEVFWFSLIILLVIFYGYAIAGFYCFSDSYPLEWGSLWSAAKALSGWCLFHGVGDFVESQGIGALFFSGSFLFLFWSVVINLVAATTRIHLSAPDADPSSEEARK